MSTEIIPCRIEIPEADLDDLRERLRRTRWPDAETVDDWSQGIRLSYLRDLCEYWLERYDWRACEASLNRFPQFRTSIDGLGIHFLHVRSSQAGALPLIMTHGWPGSIVEFRKVIGPLTDPAAHGGETSDAFHLVCPSLPGFGFSSKPARAGWGIDRIADAWDELMTRLGYEHYGAQGGDWGSGVSQALATRHAAHLAGVHISMVTAPPDPETMNELTEQERDALAAMTHFQDWESGYSKEQSTRPQTVGYGLVDSPAGLCAWIVEMFFAGTDSDGDPANVLTRDEMLDNVMLYWLPGTGASSARLYWESFDKLTSRPENKVQVPVGCSVFPKDILRPSRRWAEKTYPDLRYWNEPAKGGHFAAFEQPAIFVDEIRAAFRSFRGEHIPQAPGQWSGR